MFIYFFYSALFKIHTYICIFVQGTEVKPDLLPFWANLRNAQEKSGDHKGARETSMVIERLQQEQRNRQWTWEGKSQLQDSLREGNSLGTGHIIVQFILGYLLFEGLICISCVFKLSWTKGLVDLFWAKIFCHCCVNFSHFGFSWTTNYFQLNLP